MRILFTLFTLFTLLLLSTQSLAADTTFHPPHTQAEMALAHILKLNHNDYSNMIDFIWKYPERNTRQDKKYEQLFTQELQDAWARGYKESPMGDDGIHHYIDFDFIMCGNGDTSDTYLYATMRNKEDTAYISVAWPEEKNQNPSKTKYPFIMKEENGVWKLDGVNCGEGYAFNTDFHYTR